VETLPPFLMAATRFVVPGVALVLWTRIRGAPAPTLRQWGSAALVGNLLLLGGNGIVSWAEQWVPSGLAALLIASVPLWMGLMSFLVEPAARPRARGVVGIAIGFAGVALLVGPAGEGADGRHLFVGSIAILVASMLWAVGSLVSRRVDVPKNHLLTIGMQMLTASAGLAIAGTLGGEWTRVDPGIFTARALGALIYLILFGSFVAFAAYVWLLRVSAPAKVATYAYVNPVVAVFLGWALADEALDGRTLLAAAIIVGSVVMITTERVRRAGRPRAPGAAEVEVVEVVGGPQPSPSSASVSRSHSA
jgi:drug/metabolite transporter (DMT)-like permease